MKCETCNGSGRVNVRTYSYRDHLRGSEADYDACPYCNGHGLNRHVAHCEVADTDCTGTLEYAHGRQADCRECLASVLLVERVA